MDTDSTQNRIIDTISPSGIPSQAGNVPGEAPAGQAPQIVDSPAPAIADPMPGHGWPAAATPAASTWNWRQTITLGLVIACIGLIGSRPPSSVPRLAAEGHGTRN
jgi:hypothetical protein